jgi:hypothetical protein
MTYQVLEVIEENIIYSNGKHSCIGIDPEFQVWLRANKDNLPSDIQAKIDAGDLTIVEAE